MPRKKRGSFASPFDDMDWENEENHYILPYKISKTQVWRRSQLFLVWKISFHVEFSDNPEHAGQKEREQEPPSPPYSQCVWLQHLESSGKPAWSGKKYHLSISFYKWCFAVNFFCLFGLCKEQCLWWAGNQHEQDQLVHFLVDLEYLERCSLWIVLMHKSNYPHNQWRLYIGKDWALLLSRLFETLK